MNVPVEIQDPAQIRADQRRRRRARQKQLQMRERYLRQLREPVNPDTGTRHGLIYANWQLKLMADAAQSIVNAEYPFFSPVPTAVPVSVAHRLLHRTLTSTDSVISLNGVDAHSVGRTQPAIFDQRQQRSQRTSLQHASSTKDTNFGMNARPIKRIDQAPMSCVISMAIMMVRGFKVTPEHYSQEDFHKSDSRATPGSFQIRGYMYSPSVHLSFLTSNCLSYEMRSASDFLIAIKHYSSARWSENVRGDFALSKEDVAWLRNAVDRSHPAETAVSPEHESGWLKWNQPRNGCFGNHGPRTYVSVMYIKFLRWATHLRSKKKCADSNSAGSTDSFRIPSHIISRIAYLVNPAYQSCLNFVSEHIFIGLRNVHERTSTMAHDINQHRVKVMCDQAWYSKYSAPTYGGAWVSKGQIMDVLPTQYNDQPYLVPWPGNTTILQIMCMRPELLLQTDHPRWIPLMLAAMTTAICSTCFLDLMSRCGFGVAFTGRYNTVPSEKQKTPIVSKWMKQLVKSMDKRSLDDEGICTGRTYAYTKPLHVTCRGYVEVQANACNFARLGDCPEFDVDYVKLNDEIDENSEQECSFIKRMFESLEVQIADHTNIGHIHEAIDPTDDDMEEAGSITTPLLYV